MKRMITIVLTLILGLSALAVPAVAEDAPKIDPRCGLLTMLNISEEEYAAFMEARRLIAYQIIREGYAEQVEGPEPEGAPIVVYYDTMDAMLMALNAGDIGSMEIYQSVGRYLCATNDNLRLGMCYDLSKARNAFAQRVFSTILGNDFAFLMLEENAELRDQFSEAIAFMKADGTLDRLVQEQIEAVIAGGEAEPITMPVADGARTIRVAVTGSLPPMDYVAADGTPAGFNTAVLAEIASRTGLNIDLVVVDSIGRAAALASGTVDAVFWTRTSAEDARIRAMSEAEFQTEKAEMEAAQTEEENVVIERITAIAENPVSAYDSADMPEGTIATEAYYSDVFIPVELR